MAECCYAECHYAERQYAGMPQKTSFSSCLYAECHYAECRVANLRHPTEDLSYRVPTLYTNSHYVLCHLGKCCGAIFERFLK